MRLSWLPGMRTLWLPLMMMLGLLGLLTYLLLQSRTPTPIHDTHFYAALQEMALSDVRLTRDVLLVRAGLLPHVDSLGQTSQALRRTLATLQPGDMTRVENMAQALQPQVELLTTVVEQKLRLVEDFTADNALFQNSFLYVLHAEHVLHTQVLAMDQAPVSEDVTLLSHALLRLLHNPQSPGGAEFMEILNRLPRLPVLQQELDLLATHGRRVVELLPQVDVLVRQLLSVPTTQHLHTLQAAALQYSERHEARAQVYRLLLYLMAIALLGALQMLFTRLQAQARALQTSEEHFRAITETASEAIISADQTWGIVSWNAAATAMFGYEVPEALGMSLLRLFPERYHTTLTAGWLQGEVSWHSIPPVELIGVRKDSSEFPLALSLSTWATEQGAYMTGMLRDLTARKALEEQARQQELQLIQANKLTALGTLVSVMAHEVNNPNQLVLMNTQMLADTWNDALPILDAYAQQTENLQLGGLPYSEMRETLPLLIQDLHAGSQHIARIIDDLRDFARPDATRPQETVCLNDAVQHGVRLLRHVIQRKTTQFHLQLAESLPPVWGNAQHLAHVVVNLVVNALEALPHSDCAVRLATRVVPGEHRLILEVADQGVGIAAQHLARLCDPFFTTKAASGGTGLGLAITATLVQAHGGRLTFTSEPGQGTCVYVTLPVAGFSLAAATACSIAVR